MGNKHLYVFGAFKLDPQQKILLRDEERIPLHPKTFATLLALLECNGEVISKDDLMAKVWPDAFVEESNLTKNISNLRKALSNGHDHSDYIETIPTIGYRFTTVVRQATDIARTQPLVSTKHLSADTKGEELVTAITIDKNLPQSAQLKTVSSRKNISIFKLLIATSVLLIIFIVMFTLQVKRQANKPENSITELQINRLTSTNDAFEAAISPNGKFATYILGNTSLPSIWLKDLITKKETQLVAPTLTQFRGIVFSHDGNFIYYSQRLQHDSVFELYQLPITGGLPVKLLSGVDSAVSFSPNGKQFTFIREDQTTRKSDLLICNADGTDERHLATCTAPDNFSVDGPSWSPDGRLIAIGKMIPAPDFHFRLMSVQVADGKEQPIGETKWAWMMRVAWLSDGEGLVVVGKLKSRGINTQLWRVSYSTGEIQRITNDLNAYRNLSLAADKLITVQSELRSDVWVLQPENPASVKRITNTPTNQNGIGLTWTQDKQIVYTSNIGGHQELWIMNSDGTESRQLTPDADEHNRFPVISSSGNHVIFGSGRSGPLRIWRINTDGRDLKVMSRGSSDLNPQYSPDEKWIVYSSEISKNTSQRVIVKMDSSANISEPIALTTNYSDYPVISPNGQWLAFLFQETTSSPRKIALMPFSGTNQKQLLDIPYLSIPIINWHPNNNAICYLDNKENSSNIWAFPIHGGIPAKLTNFTDQKIFQYAWSKDGHTLACARGIEARDVVLLEGVK